MPKLITLTAVLLSLAGCASASANRPVVATTFANGEVRRAFLEATLRELDENPEYVDEMFRIARRHPATLDRFLTLAIRESHDPAFATFTAQHLIEQPEALREILIRTLDEARRNPEARQAIARAIEQRAQLSASIIADRPSALRATLDATVAVALRRERARRAFLAGMRGNSDELARMLATDTETLNAMSASLAVYAREILLELLRDAG